MYDELYIYIRHTHTHTDAIIKIDRNTNSPYIGVLKIRKKLKTVLI